MPPIHLSRIYYLLDTMLLCEGPPKPTEQKQERTQQLTTKDVDQLNAIVECSPRSLPLTTAVVKGLEEVRIHFPHRVLPLSGYKTIELVEITRKTEPTAKQPETLPRDLQADGSKELGKVQGGLCRSYLSQDSVNIDQLFCENGPITAKNSSQNEPQNISIEMVDELPISKIEKEGPNLTTEDVERCKYNLVESNSPPDAKTHEQLNKRRPSSVIRCQGFIKLKLYRKLIKKL